MLRLIAVGDVALDSPREGNPLRGLAGILGSGAVVFGNLETVLSDREDATPAEKHYLFRAPASSAAFLAEAGISVVSLANNHILDYGADCLLDTVRALDRHGIAHVGAGRSCGDALAPAILEREGVRLGFLGFASCGDAPPAIPGGSAAVARDDPRTILACVGELRRNVDVVAVSLHWGIEGARWPLPEQQALARAIVDAGAHLVLGHGPHVVQGIEEYRGAHILYSLGNCQIICTPGSETARGLIACFEPDGPALRCTPIPIELDHDHRPQPLPAREREAFLQGLSQLSRRVTAGLATGFVMEEIGWAYIAGNLESWRVRIRRYGLRHFLQFCRWLASLFVLRCSIGAARRGLRRLAWWNS
ncbi:MAG: CapA family protein [Anaerolineae bacterium]|nr:CapA family protein [Anaerolineae bacterium]